MRTIAAVIAVAALAASISTGAQATDNRYVLASQSNFADKHGFYVDLENSALGQIPCRLEDLKLAFGVADGAGWHFSVQTVPWQFGHLYSVTATVGKNTSQIAVDGGAPTLVPVDFSPDPSLLVAKELPGWASGPADYRVAETGLTVHVSTEVNRAQVEESWTVEGNDAQSLQLLTGELSPTYAAPLTIPIGATATVTVTFELLPQPGDPAGRLRTLSPLVDRYGQPIAANWPNKIKRDGDLTAPIPVELAQYRRWGNPVNRDQYGGATHAGWRANPSGYFSLLRHGGRWWLITPEGNPCFYIGLDTAPDVEWDGTPVTGREFLFADLPPHDGIYSAAWSKNAWGDGVNREYCSFTAANLIRKYGPDWKVRGTQSCAERLKVWGFTGVGKWGGNQDIMPAGIPSTPVLGHSDVPNLVGHPDIFDPKVQDELRESLRKQIVPRLTDPAVVAWSIGNEYDEIVTPDEIKKILAMPESVPARQALTSYAVQSLYHGDSEALDTAWKRPGGSPQPSETDVEALRQFYESRYYAFLYATVKSIDPHHLYAGYWPSIGWWVGPQDWTLLAPYCDVIGFDRYDANFADPVFQKLLNKTDKPVLCGEFSYPPYYAGRRGFGKYGVSAVDEADAGRLYARWVAAAAAEPHCVGVCWFEYRDEPETGRGPGEGPQATLGEHYAFGLVNDTDQPKWDLVNGVRKANLAAMEERLRH